MINKTKAYALLCIVLMVFLPRILDATIWYVHPDSVLNSIQAGLDSCAANDTVLVGPGIYYENIDWPYVQGLHLISEYGPDTTIIDGSNSGSVIYLSLIAEDSTTLIHGFTIRNGSAWLGGGIYSVGGKPTISGNVITGNTAHWLKQGRGSYPEAGATGIGHIEGNVLQEKGPPPQGGGIYSEWSSAIIVDNVITANDATSNGGGIACLCDAANIAPKIVNNIITNNTAHTGGAIYIECPFAMTIIRENTISMNTANYGGGIACYYVFQPLLAISKNTVMENTADSAGGGIWCYLNSRPFIDSCVVRDNVGDGIYSGYTSLPVIGYNNITNNSGFGVRNVDQSVTVLAENNWWGDATGPYNPLTNPGGLGDTVSDYVDYDPWMISPGICELVPSRSIAISLQVSPNPFSHRTIIRYSIPDSRYLIKTPIISIYDISGRHIESFNLESNIPGLVERTGTGKNQESAVSWNGTDSYNRKLPGGVYFVRFVAGDHTEIQKLVLLR